MAKERNILSLESSGKDNLEEVWEFNLYIKVIEPSKRAHSQPKVSQNFLEIYLKLPKIDLELSKKYITPFHFPSSTQFGYPAP